MMKTKTKNWIPKFIALAVFCLLIGVGIGLLGYHYFLKPVTPSDWQSTKIEPTKEVVENIYLIDENGKQKTIDPKGEEGIGLASLLTRKLHELNLQARCVFSEEDIRGIKQKDRVAELVFMNPIDITISQLVEPEEWYPIPDEKGYRILKNVETALFILEDILDEGLEAHILVGSERKDRDERCSWKVTEKDREKYKELGPIWSMIAGYEFDEKRGCVPVGGEKHIKDVVPFKTKKECQAACGKIWGCWTIEKGDEGLDKGWIDDVNKIISTEQYVAILCCEECLKAFSRSPIGVGPEAAMCGKFSSGYNMSKECKQYFKEHPSSVAKCKSLLNEQSENGQRQRQR